jgi:BolA protein
MTSGPTADRILHKLRKAFSPSELEVTDDSAKHAGHAGSRPGGETHFRLRITADVFDGKTRIERHRMIHNVLTEELAGRVHALAITALGNNEKLR